MGKKKTPAVGPAGFSPEHLAKLEEIEQATGSPLPARFRLLCESFLSELDKWNKRMNLISAKDWDRVVERHVLDSLSLLAYESRLAGRQILDVGTGAGFPGLVLAMCESRARFLLVESRSKPVAFLRAVRRTLGLDNVEIVHSRLESLANSETLPRVDLITSRAVGGTARLAEHAVSLLKPGGAIIVYTARRPRQSPLAAGDVSTLKQLGLGVDFITPPWQSLTTLMILQKLTQTDK